MDFALSSYSSYSSPSFKVENDKPFVKIIEVGPRDGLQIQPKFIDTSVKVELIDMLSRCGLHEIDATSFVSPKAVPQLKDAVAVMKSIKRNSNVTYHVHVPNLKGLEMAVLNQLLLNIYFV